MNLEPQRGTTVKWMQRAGKVTVCPAAGTPRYQANTKGAKRNIKNEPSTRSVSSTAEALCKRTPKSCHIRDLKLGPWKAVQNQSLFRFSSFQRFQRILAVGAAAVWRRTLQGRKAGPVASATKLLSLHICLACFC